MVGAGFWQEGCNTLMSFTHASHRATVIRESSKVSCSPCCRFSVVDEGFQFTVIKRQGGRFHLSTALVSGSTAVFTEDWQSTAFPTLLLPPPFIVFSHKSSGCQNAGCQKLSLYWQSAKNLSISPMKWRIPWGKTLRTPWLAAQLERVQKHWCLGRTDRDVMVWMPKIVPWIAKISYSC